MTHPLCSLIMNTSTLPATSSALVREVDARMSQALGNFFQRNRETILDGVLRAINGELTPSMLAAGQTCMDWLNTQPDRLSEAFADAFRQPLAAHAADEPVGEMRLVDEAQFARQLDENRAASRIADALGPEITILSARLAWLTQGGGDVNPGSACAPQAIVAALSRALNGLGFDLKSGSLLLRNAAPALEDTLRHTYAALDQFLAAHGIEMVPAAAPVARGQRPFKRSFQEVSPGAAILAHLHGASAAAMASAGQTSASPAPGGLVGGFAAGAPRTSFLDSLDFWQLNLPRLAEIAPDAPALLLRQLQRRVHETDAGAFDLAMLDAVASLFEFILDDPNVSPAYKSEIAQLQIPALRVALSSPEFFSDDAHPARRMIDLLGQVSRRFPDSHAIHESARERVESACTHIINQTAHPLAAFVEAHDTLSAWFGHERARADAGLALDVARLERIERQELGTLLALENLQDLTARHGAPESVLRRLEAAWVPHMATLYVDEAGEGPTWRAASATLAQLFQSLRPPQDEAAREAMLAAIPGINSALREGLLAQQATAEQLRDFFAALTAAQECWIRPALGQPETLVSHFIPQTAARTDIASAMQELSETQAPDPALREAEALLEGDWVDFDPPYEGLSTARVAWVGVHGYFLFCDSDGETRFSLDDAQLADEIRAGRASIPEQSLTRKAMLRLRTQLQSGAV